MPEEAVDTRERWKRWYKNVIFEHDQMYYKAGVFGSYNKMWLSGMFSSDFIYVHKENKERYYRSDLKIVKEGKIYKIEIIATGTTLAKYDIPKEVKGKVAEIAGEFRSTNYCGLDGQMHLYLYGFAKKISVYQHKTEVLGNLNIDLVYISGFIYKPVSSGVTMGSNINMSNVYIVANRKDKTGDYIPCVAWGKDALFAQNLKVSDKVELYGVITSRTYTKYDEYGVPETKMVNEVSIIDIKRKL